MSRFTLAIALFLGFVLIVAGFIAHAEDAPRTYVFTAEQVAIIAQLAAEKRAAAQAAYNQANELIAEIQRQSAAPKPPEVKK